MLCLLPNNLINENCRLLCICLFVVLSLVHPTVTDKITIHSFYFINYFLVLAVFNHFWTTRPHRIPLTRLDLLLCVHAHFIGNFSSLCSVFLCLFF